MTSLAQDATPKYRPTAEFGIAHHNNVSQCERHGSPPAGLKPTAETSERWPRPYPRSTDEIAKSGVLGAVERPGESVSRQPWRN